MSELVMSELTFYGGGTFIKKGLVRRNSTVVVGSGLIG
jgi:hypothetical protein